jgi:hypothetical protein
MKQHNQKSKKGSIKSKIIKHNRNRLKSKEHSKKHSKEHSKKNVIKSKRKTKNKIKQVGNGLPPPEGRKSRRPPNLALNLNLQPLLNKPLVCESTPEYDLSLVRGINIYFNENISNLEQYLNGTFVSPDKDFLVKQLKLILRKKPELAEIIIEIYIKEVTTSSGYIYLFKFNNSDKMYKMDLIMVEGDTKGKLCIEDKALGEKKVKIVKKVSEMKYSPPLLKINDIDVIIDYCIDSCYRYIYFTEYLEGFTDYNNLEEEVMKMENSEDKILMAQQLIRALEIVYLMSYNLNKAHIIHSDLHSGNVIIRKDSLKSKSDLGFDDVYIVDWELAIIDLSDITELKLKAKDFKAKDDSSTIELELPTDMMMKDWIHESKENLDAILGVKI